MRSCCRPARGPGVSAESAASTSSSPSSARTPTIGTSSVRRVAQLTRLLPGARFAPIRGNLDTRLRKLDSGEYDAIVLAAAGLRRLGFASRISFAAAGRCLCAGARTGHHRHRDSRRTTTRCARRSRRSPIRWPRRRSKPSEPGRGARRRVSNADWRARASGRGRCARAGRGGDRARRQPRRPRLRPRASEATPLLSAARWRRN